MNPWLLLPKRNESLTFTTQEKNVEMNHWLLLHKRNLIGPHLIGPCTLLGSSFFTAAYAVWTTARAPLVRSAALYTLTNPPPPILWESEKSSVVCASCPTKNTVTDVRCLKPPSGGFDTLPDSLGASDLSVILNPTGFSPVGRCMISWQPLCTPWHGNRRGRLGFSTIINYSTDSGCWCSHAALTHRAVPRMWSTCSLTSFMICGVFSSVSRLIHTTSRGAARPLPPRHYRLPVEPVVRRPRGPMRTSAHFVFAHCNTDTRTDLIESVSLSLS